MDEYRVKSTYFKIKKIKCHELNKYCKYNSTKSALLKVKFILLKLKHLLTQMGAKIRYYY